MDPSTISLATIKSELAGQGQAVELRTGLDKTMASEPTVVIVVDDNPAFLKSVTRLLSVHGFETKAFASAEALLDSDDARTAKCLLLDIHLGGISGIDLRRRLTSEQPGVSRPRGTSTEMLHSDFPNSS